MHSIVQATCQRCGDVELAPCDLQLRVCSTPDASIYVFTCPRCEQIVVKPASDGRIVTLLQSVGVQTYYWDLPAELDEAKDGPPLTVDDLIDFHFALERPDWATLLPTA
jgi:hypothetical protein